MNVRSLLSRRVFTAVAIVTVLTGGFLMGRARADQPHMQAALGHLESAKSELEAASADKGGHRTKAIELVDDAIAQVQRGIEFARNR